VYAESSKKSTIQDAVVYCPADARVCWEPAEAGSAEALEPGAPAAGVKQEGHCALADEKGLVFPQAAKASAFLQDEGERAWVPALISERHCDLARARLADATAHAPEHCCGAQAQVWIVAQAPAQVAAKEACPRDSCSVVVALGGPERA
jgi:hypothetical protein